MLPLEDIRVLDFSTLLPGPFATLILAEAGAEVIKVERPGGEPMRGQQPKYGDSAMLFGQLNRGKKSIELDLKDPDSVANLRPLIETADVLVEQFRPGVMDRLGLGWNTVHEINPRLIYCAITGYGQSGPRLQEAGHDLNYAAETGLLSLSRAADGAPVIPHTQIADIGAGSYPAVMNIMFALHARGRTGEGCFLDISMTDNLFPFTWMGIGLAQATGVWPTGADMALTGASPRYQIYRAEDGIYVAVGALEQKFWDNFCDAIELGAGYRDDRDDPASTIAEVARLIAAKPASSWAKRFEGKDVCSVLMNSLEQAFHDPHFRQRGVFGHSLTQGRLAVAALPMPLAPLFHGTDLKAGYPALGNADALLYEPR
ncbi:MAG: CoA transferase [Alphaproteobacteria bacterium]|jgi:crotonobetainyl-CoA:carnitine CoA-transferase CaiB-like acyl-CoA transferase|nr:CoA transferase [Alphaproteobacteria bacterium]MDP6515111.1 CoA transferase [Alphaproteobacteria bacterium]